MTKEQLEILKRVPPLPSMSMTREDIEALNAAVEFIEKHSYTKDFVYPGPDDIVHFIKDGKLYKAGAAQAEQVYGVGVCECWRSAALASAAVAGAGDK